MRERVSTYHLREVILVNSIAKYFNEAICEWTVTRFYRKSNETCVCGKKHIANCSVIFNSTTGIELDPVGSKCILNFGTPYMIMAMHALEKEYDEEIKRQATEREKCERMMMQEEDERLMHLERPEILRKREAIAQAIEKRRVEALKKREEDEKIWIEAQKKKAEDERIERIRQEQVRLEKAKRRQDEKRVSILAKGEKIFENEGKKCNGMTFKNICKYQASYIAFIRTNAFRLHYKELVEYYDAIQVV